MSDYLPIEVWTDILTRLPIKTLLQIRSVCKLFHSLISNPTFNSIHLSRTKQKQICKSSTFILRHFTDNGFHERENFWMFNDSIPIPSSIGDNNNMVHLDFPFRTKSSCHFRIVGSCNGVLCLSDDHVDNRYGIILWNPTVKRFLRLPRPRVCERIDGSYMFVLGFGYDCKSDDYKVVMVAYVWGRKGKVLIPPEVEVYSLSARAWRSFSVGAPPYGIYGFTWTQAFVNGAVHWAGYDPCMTRGNDQHALIVSFNVSDEQFREVGLPLCLEQYGWDLSATVVRGGLGVLQNECRGRRGRCSVWVMEEYGVVDSWVKLYSVDLVGGLHKLVGLLDNREVLGVTVRGKLVTYDPITSRMKTVGIRGDKGAFHVEAYMESLALLDAERADIGTEAVIFGGGEEEEDAPRWPSVTNRSAELVHAGELDNLQFGWTIGE